MQQQGTSQAFLLDECARAQPAGIQYLKRFAQSIAGHRTGLMTWHDKPISIGLLEGTNNKIKTTKKKACGYRDIKLIKLEIKAQNEKKHALFG